MNTLQSTNIILIHKIKRIREVDLADLFWFIDYGYRLASVQNSVSQSREQCRSESRTVSVRVDKQNDQAKCLYRTVSVKVDKQNDQAKCLYRTVSVRVDKQNDQAKCLYWTVSVRVDKQNDQAKTVETARDHYPYKVWAEWRVKTPSRVQRTDSNKTMMAYTPRRNISRNNAGQFVLRFW